MLTTFSQASPLYKANASSASSIIIYHRIMQLLTYIDDLYLQIMFAWAEGCILNSIGTADGCGYDSQQNTLFVTLVDHATRFQAQ